MTDTNVAVVALIKDNSGKYLFIKPTDYKDFGDYQDAWYPPTGHVKENESMEKALIRELKEELNLDIKPVRLLTEWEQDIKGETAFWWECKILKGRIKKSHEIKDFGYFSEKEVEKLKLWPATVKYFEKYVWNNKND